MSPLLLYLLWIENAIEDEEKGTEFSQSQKKDSILPSILVDYLNKSGGVSLYYFWITLAILLEAGRKFFGV